jgi:hypothetical protein
MIKQLVQLANHLDNKGLVKEASYLDSIIRKASNTPGDYYNPAGLSPEVLKALDIEEEKRFWGNLESDPDELSEEEVLSIETPEEMESGRHQADSPEEELLQKMHIAEILREKHPNKTNEEIADHLSDGDEEVREFVLKILSSPLYS